MSELLDCFLEPMILSLALAGKSDPVFGLYDIDFCRFVLYTCTNVPLLPCGRNPIPSLGDYDTRFIKSKKCDCKSRGSSTRWNVKQPSRCSDGAPIADVLLRWSVQERHILTQLSALPLLFGLGVPLLTVLA